MPTAVESLVPSLVTNACNGNMTAFDRLRAHYQARVIAFCIHLLHNREDAEQAAQETFIRAWRSLHGYRYHLSFSAWLLKIAQNICLNLVRTQKYHVHRHSASLDDPNSTIGFECSVENDDIDTRTKQIYASQLMEILRRKVNTHKPKWDTLDWDIFMLRVDQGEENFAEIARILQKSVDTIKYRYRAHILPICTAVRRDLVVSWLQQERSAYHNGNCVDKRIDNTIEDWQDLDWQLLRLVYGEDVTDFEMVARKCRSTLLGREKLTADVLRKRYESHILPMIVSIEAELSSN